MNLEADGGNVSKAVLQDLSICEVHDVAAAVVSTLEEEQEEIESLADAIDAMPEGPKKEATKKDLKVTEKSFLFWQISL